VYLDIVQAFNNTSTQVVTTTTTKTTTTTIAGVLISNPLETYGLVIAAVAAVVLVPPVFDILYTRFLVDPT
jgi:hypothetical protein